MKNSFPGYYTTNKDLRNLLTNSLVTIDYEVLLTLNKISHSRILLSILNRNEIKDKLWMPYDTAWMYHTHVQKAIESQIEKVDSAKVHLTSFSSLVEDPFNHPYINEELVRSYKYLTTTVAKALIKERSYLIGTLKGLDIKKSIAALFEGKIGVSYNDADLQAVISEAKEREQLEQPPCLIVGDYKTEREKYHYFIVWKQLIKQAMDKQCDIILITDHITDNWYVSYIDTVAITHHELVNEFKKITGQSFICISAYNFVSGIARKDKNRGTEYDKLLAQLNASPQARRPDISANQL